MLKFREFLQEEPEEEVLSVDTQYVNDNTPAINAELDVLTNNPYQNAPIFLAQLRGVLERYSMILPSTATKNFLNLDAEMVYTLGETGNYMYIVYNTNEDGMVDGYAQIVSEEELEDLLDMDTSDVVNSDREMVSARHSDWYRKHDDDAGDTGEY